MKVLATLTPLVLSLHLLDLRQSREQRLRFRDLGHFRRESKAFERRRKNGVRLGRAVG